jgi:predicted ArsR family transcriptional regulator
LSEDIDKQILKYLSEQDWPVTSEMVAANVKISWNTAQIHLYKLSAEGSVKGKRVGRQNQWVLARRK